jgi:acyl-CoA reductase-like NAD-dependent aldehyde dehydrogenase
MMNPKDVIAELDAKHGIFINGRGLGTASTFDVRDPATCAVIAEISDGTASEATSAVEAAARAFPEWAATAPRVRAEILRREIFGPVAPIVLWDNEDELLDWINDTEYGLAAYVYSGRLQDAPYRRVDRCGHGGDQPRHRVRSFGPLRRDEAKRARARRRPGRDA